MNQKFNITGMSCSACSAAVDRSVKKLEGINECQVNLLTNSMTVSFDNSILSENDIISAVNAAGYGASVDGNKKTVSIKTKTDDLREMKIRLIVSFSCLIPLMYIAMGHMISLPLPSFLSGTENGVAFAFIQFLLTLPIIYFNRKYYINGFKSLFRRSPNMDTLVATGSLAAIVYGIYSVFAIGSALGSGDTQTASEFMHNLYFESGAMILTLITLGKFFEAKSKKKTSDAITKLMELAPDTASVERGGKEYTIKTNELKTGDIIIVRSGPVRAFP